MTSPAPPQISYIDPDGGVWYLSDMSLSNGYICTDIAGIDGLPVSFSSSPLLNGGSLPQIYVPQPGSVVIGLYLESQGDVNAYMKLLDKFAYAFFNQRDGKPVPGQLVIQRQDGTSRFLNVYTVSGADTATDWMPTWATYTLTLQSDDPFWYDLTPQQSQYILAGQASGILPLLPINLGSSTVIGSSTLVNDGGAEAYPIWLITGPGLPNFANLTTGRQFSLQSVLASGQVIQVDTRPGLQSAVDINSGTNLWSGIVKASPRDLWSLAVGVNKINLAMGGAGPASNILLT